nr:virulence protein E [Bacteroidota bacterium]
MLQAGKNITAIGDPLQKLQVGQFFNALINPKPAIRDAIEQLRLVLTIDAKKYSVLKRNLPYVTCGIFSPPYRKTENFASIGVFMLDIDHLSQKELLASQLKEKMKADNRIELMFESPGGDGLKILFRLSEKCFDPVKYSMFYKVFAKAFSDQYGLSQVIDTRTSDVTRACFVSIDSDAFFNENAEKINMAAYINFDDPFQVNEIKRMEKEEKIMDDPEPPINELTDDVLLKIKQKLNPNIRTAREKNITVPEELDKLIPKIGKHVEKYNLAIAEIKNIHYGKQLRFTAGTHFAVINLFYGKNGYKVVNTTKSGSSNQLVDIANRVLCELLFSENAT